MDFKSLISKISELDDKIKTVAAPTLPNAIKLNEDAELRVLAGTSSVLAEAKKMKKEDKKEKVDEGGLDMNLVKAAQKGQEGKPMGKPDAESDKNVRKKYGYRMDGEPAERDSDETKQDRRGRKRKNTGESIVEDGGEGVEDLMAAAEEEYKQPGSHIDNLQDVMNSTFDADDSPEFERAREIINRYLEFVTNTDVDHYDDEEDPDHEDEPMIRAMKHGNIQKHIREYDLGDYLVSAIHELKKAVGKGESFNRRAFESKFAKMVEAKKMKGKKADDKMDEASKPDFLDLDKDGDKKEPMKKAAAEKGGDKKDAGKKGMTAAQKKLPPGLQKAIAKKSESVEEGNDPLLKRGYMSSINKTPRKGQTNFDNIPAGNHPDSRNRFTDDDRKNRRTQLKRDIKKSLGQHKKPNLPENTETKSVAKKKSKTESVRRSKKVVAESLEPILKFRDMIKLVQESGGQQQIDPIDKALFTWAERVAKSKLGEGMKAEIYAGMIYERNGGRFEMYDVLAEDQK